MQFNILHTLFLLTFSVQCFTQQLIYADTIGQYEVFIEKAGEEITVYAKKEGKTDTVWNNFGGGIPIEKICYVNIFDDSKFVMLYSLLGACIYLIKERDGDGWQPGMTELVQTSSDGYCPWVEVVDAQTLRVQHIRYKDRKDSVGPTGFAEEIKFDLTNKTTTKKIIKK